MKQTPFEKTSKARRVTACRCCGNTDLRPWFSLPDQPPANNFLSNESEVEECYPLRLLYCPTCELIQLSHVVDPTVLFDRYVYLSSTSKVFVQHFEALAERVLLDGIVNANDLVVDIGSNDGILLKPFQKAGVRVVGVEPCEAIALAANHHGIMTINEYFSPRVAHIIREKFGEAQLVTMTNVFAHVDNIDAIIEGVQFLLADGGHLMLEFPDTMEMLKQGTFDLIYHEHLSYFTVPSITRYLEKKGFLVEYIERTNVHGGSLRVWVKDGYGVGSMSKQVATWFKKEVGFTRRRLFQEFPQKLKKHEEQLMKLVWKLRTKTIVGYGAPAKMSTLTNSYGIMTESVVAIIDDSPMKQRLFSPGQHIPIIAKPKYSNAIGIDYIFIFAWNFAESIMKSLRNDGFTGPFIIPFPTPRIIRLSKDFHAGRNQD